MFRRRKDTPEAAATRLRFAVIGALTAGYSEPQVVLMVRRVLNDARLVRNFDES